MKKIIIALIALIPFVKSFGQFDDTTQYTFYRYSYGTRAERIWANKVLRAPTDTIYTKSGLAIVGGTLYVGNGVKWSQVTGGGGGGSDSGFSVQTGANTSLIPVQKYVDGSGNRFIRSDTSKSNPGAIVTQASRQKLSDSLQSIFNALIATKISDSGFAVQIGQNTSLVPFQKYIVGNARFERADTSQGNPGAIVTQASRKKLADSLNAVLRGALVANALNVQFIGYGPYASHPTSLVGIYIASDSAQTGALFYDNAGTMINLTPQISFSIRGLGQPGDTTMVTLSGSLLSGFDLNIAAIRDSSGSCVHHVFNPDGSLTFYSTCSGGGSLANPTGTIDLTTHNGTSTNGMRADGTPPLSQAIQPTWTAPHTHLRSPIMSALTPGMAVATDPATDSLLSVQRLYHGGVRLATAAALPANTYNNGAGTITATSNALLAVDVVNVAANDTILVRLEANPTHNGIYVVTQPGSGSTPFILTRTPLAAVGENMRAGSFVYVYAGSTLANTIFYQQTSGPITFGTTNLVYGFLANVAGGLFQPDSMRINMQGIPAYSPTRSIVIMGTSIVFGVGADTPQRDFANLLAGILNRALINNGHNGYVYQNPPGGLGGAGGTFMSVYNTSGGIPTKTPDMQWLFIEGPDNDQYYQNQCPSCGYTKAKLILSMDTVVTYALAHGWSTSNIFIISPFWQLRSHTPIVFQDSAFLGAQTVASTNGLVFIDVYNTTKSFWDSATDQSIAVHRDGVHPSNQGHAAGAIKSAQMLDSINVPEPGQGFGLQIKGTLEASRLRVRNLDTADLTTQLLGYTKTGYMSAIPRGTFPTLYSGFPTTTGGQTYNYNIGNMFIDGHGEFFQSFTSSGIRVSGNNFSPYWSGWGLEFAVDGSGNGYANPFNRTTSTYANFNFQHSSVNIGTNTLPSGWSGTGLNVNGPVFGGQLYATATAFTLPFGSNPTLMLGTHNTVGEIVTYQGSTQLPTAINGFTTQPVLVNTETNNSLAGLQVNSAIYAGDSVILNKVRDGTGSDSIPVLHQLTSGRFVVHKVSQASISGAGASPILFSQTAAGSAIASGTAATLFGSGVGSLTIPANSLQAGQTITIHGYAAIGTASSPGALSFNPTVGGAGWSIGINPAGSISAGTLEFTFSWTILTTGSSGTALGSYTILTSGANPSLSVNSGTTTINTTGILAIDVQVQWSTFASGDTFTSQISTVQKQ